LIARPKSPSNRTPPLRFDVFRRLSKELNGIYRPRPAFVPPKTCDSMGQEQVLQSAAFDVTLRNVTDSNGRPRPLTELQQAIVDFLWTDGPATSDQVREALLPKHPLKDSSVRTLLRRLESQGHLRHRLSGQSYVYEANAPSHSSATRTVRQLIDRFWAGSAERFVVGMIDENMLSAEQLERLAKKVRNRK
jgi:BlaI family transcriptional regulator, penicillinase repressor